MQSLILIIIVITNLVRSHHNLLGKN